MEICKPIIELRGVSMQWEGKNILSDVNLTVNRGDFLAITGPNGGGKTTLLRIMLRLLRPSAGDIPQFGRRRVQPASNRLSAPEKYD